MKTSFRIPATTVGLLAIMLTTGGWASQDPASSSTAAAEAAEPAANSVQQIPNTLKAVEEARAGKYGKLTPRDSRRLDTAERDIRALMQRTPDLTTLNDAERVQLLNAQETIIAVVDGLKGSELVCTYKQEPGTRFKTKHCVTRDMAEAAKRAAGEATKTAQRDLCVPGQEGVSPCQ